MKRTIKTLTAVAAFSLASSVFAAMPVPMGWYLEGNVGESMATNKDYGTGTSTDDSGFGWNVNAGYKFMPYFGLEAGYTHYATTTINNSAGTQVGQDTHYSVDVAGKGILPVGISGFEFFAKLGAVRGHSHTTITNTSAASGLGIPAGTRNNIGFYMALGADYAFMPELTGNIQWARAKCNSSIGYLDLYSVGLAYVFD